VAEVTILFIKEISPKAFPYPKLATIVNPGFNPNIFSLTVNAFFFGDISSSSSLSFI